LIIILYLAYPTILLFFQQIEDCFSLPPLFTSSLSVAMHPVNLNLAPPVVAGIEQNDADNWSKIQQLMTACLEEDDVVDAKLLGKLLRLIETRLSLKYNNNVTVLSSCVDTLLVIYTQKRISVPMKLKSLNVMISMFKYRKNALTLSVVYNFKPFWDEMFSICTRTAKDKSCGSEVLNSKLFQTLCDFLHEARYYTSPEQADELVVNAMDLLSDLRSPNHMFGVHMLVLCLPTEYANYDAWIGVWLEQIASITHNDGWDACWLTLLCRARKYSTEPDVWAQAALPQLLVKAAELLDPL
jgi:hypothetical protein